MVKHADRKANNIGGGFKVLLLEKLKTTLFLPKKVYSKSCNCRDRDDPNAWLGLWPIALKSIPISGTFEQ